MTIVSPNRFSTIKRVTKAKAVLDPISTIDISMKIASNHIEFHI